MDAAEWRAGLGGRTLDPGLAPWLGAGDGKNIQEEEMLLGRLCVRH